MTPLAHRIVRELTLPLKDRTFNDQCGLLKRMDDIHCFDVTECIDILSSFAKDLSDAFLEKSSFPDRLAFLPAPKTWIEWKQTSDGSRIGFLLDSEDFQHNGARTRAAMQSSDGRVFGCANCYTSDPDGFGLLLSGQMSEAKATRRFIMPIATGSERQDFWLMWFLYAALALINTPRIIGRRQHMPHRGLERRLVAAQGLQGKFPLHAWTEILLRVTPPKDVSGDEPHEAHYTGKKALHFCRAHLRVRNGKVEFVSAHWRGDGSLGIKQSRYRLAPPKAGEGMAA